MKIFIKLLLLKIILISTTAFSQTINGKIINDEHLPIYQAKIGIENIGTRTDSNGYFKINFDSITDENKNVLISANGYNIKEIPLKEFINGNYDSIILTEKAIEIAEVIVNPKKLIERNWGNSNNKMSYSSYDSENNNSKFKESAVKFDNKRKIKIKKINLGISYYEFSEPITIIFDVYNSVNKYPGESLTYEPLILKINNSSEIKDNMISLDISDKNIWVNEDFFVSYRVDENFKGKITIGGNIMAFTKDTYYREYFENWSKFSMGVPAINIDLLIKQ